MNKHYKAENEKLFRNKITQEIVGKELFLAKDDNIENYEEVDIPEELN